MDCLSEIRLILQESEVVFTFYITRYSAYNNLYHQKKHRANEKEKTLWTYLLYIRNLEIAAKNMAIILIANIITIYEQQHW